MKKIIQTITKKNVWLVNFTSCVAGTILGIALTFGISYYLDKQEKKELFVKTIDFSLSNIERHIKDMENEVKLSAHRDSLFAVLDSCYPLGASKANADTVEMCIDEFFTFNFLGMDNTAHSIFTSSIETWRNTNNIRLIEDIGDCFAMIDLYNNEMNEIKELREAMVKDFLDNNKLYYTFSAEEKAEAFFNTKGFEFFMHKYNIYSRVVKYLSHDIKEGYKLADSSFCVELGLDPKINTYKDSKLFEY